MKIKEFKRNFSEIDGKTRVMLNIYLMTGIIIMILSCIYNYIIKDAETSFLMIELSMIFVSIGIWGSLFCEIYKKLYKK